ncbi:MAG: DEAD/DEAH box helicase [Spirochaetota bacterium]
MDSFSSLGLDEVVAGGLKALGFTEPTAVQIATIPAILAGRDVLMESETGTGKTFAFLAPILTEIAKRVALGERGKGPLALVAAPTQELAVQIGREAERLASASGLDFEVAVLLGGAPVSRQEAMLKKATPLVIGTLGRLADLAAARVLKTGHLRFLILDEADRLLANETEDLVTKLVETIPGQAIRVLASATLPSRTRRIASPWLRDPLIVEARTSAVLSGDIEHWVFYCDSRKRLDFIRRFEAAVKPERCLVFTSNAARLEETLDTLSSFGLPIEGISARRDKESRRVALDRFAHGQLRYLLTSDLGARGLDIPAVSHSLSLDLPEEPTVYIHRAGRTGRAGAKGISIVLADGVELRRASKLAVREGFVFRTKVLREGIVFEPPTEDFFATVEAAEEMKREARAARRQR